jgi:spore maturation protein CgeB
MRILYGGPLNLGSTSEHRLRAFRRSVSEDIVEFPFERYLASALPPMRRITERFLVSPAISAINRALLQTVAATRPDCVWLDKPVYFHPKTIERLAASGAKTISYMPDDPFGPRNDAVWRHFTAALPHYWGHVVTREITRREFCDRGAKRVVSVPFAFEPSLHFPPGAVGLSPPRSLDLSFVGSPYDNRAEWIMKLATDLPDLRFGLFGPGWERHAARLKKAGISCNPSIWNDQYREVIWRSKLSLSFVTRSNRDELSHKAIEIAASGTAVLVEHSPVHNRVFRDRESAYFFDDPNTLSEVIRSALGRGEEFKKIGLHAAECVRAAGLSNDVVLCGALDGLGFPSGKKSPAVLGSAPA